ncbi:MAG: isoquinoline 1-oxidoreductase beta subunit, partial [Limisphaerales bacterium]
MFRPMSRSKKLSRRGFIVRAGLAGTGVLLGATYFGRHAARRGIAGMINSFEGPYSGNTKTPTLWFEITELNEVIFHCPKVEMGQGTLTGLAQIAADELEVRIDQIKMVHAATSTGNIDGASTGGSTSISSLWNPLRELAATMREMVKNKAAEKMGIDVSQLSVADGVITGYGQSMTYGQAVKGVTEWKIPKTPPLKDIKSYKYIGKPIARIDLKEKVLGAP